ncbi:MAG TPA: mannose-1-phosphate guanylyltransferase/mannose-6-phosphate isomerase [Gammaproteobacteria bacterium]|nr:mannose-1-phosphate guanylyltransferase/mannose-6-phosphate isomerase [Gammaproteobacteria bacterium]
MIIQPVILSGGSGTRLWPLSREFYPKQLLAPQGGDTLLQATVKRLAGLEEQGVATAPPLVVCNEEHRFLVAEQLRQAGLNQEKILLEPVGRNTAPAATLAALRVEATHPGAVMLLMPADHLIQDRAAFQSAVACGASLAAEGTVVTFGIVPTRPETGYGYIKMGQPAKTPHPSPYTPHVLEKFVEKPDQATAEGYLASGEYLWNSGIFMVSARAWLQHMTELQPEMLAACQTAYEAGAEDGDFYRVAREAFEACPSDSIDYAVMEKISGHPTAAEPGWPAAAVIPLDAGWSDVGAWSSLWEVIPQDEEGNIVRGDVMAHGVRNSLLMAEHRLLAAIGVEDVIVVETADAVLVVHKDQAQAVKEVVQRLKSRGRSEHLVHRQVHRPWGCYEGVDAGDRFQVKRITVKPGASLSLQMHHHRAEHWVVVRGTARVTKGEESFLLSENESTYIPIGVTHRLENPGTLPLEIIEVQSGSYLGEDDIVRFEDDYGRG